MLDLLKIIDGTWFREYENGEVFLPFFYIQENYSSLSLCSWKQMIMLKQGNEDFIKKLFIHEDINCDIEINKNTDNTNLLIFANSKNNESSVRLYLDFNPSEDGTIGQVVAYLHDSNELVILEKSFDEFLLEIMNSDFGEMFENFDEEIETTRNKDLEDEYFDFEDITQNLFWKFNKQEYNDIKKFAKDFKKYMKTMDEDITASEMKEIILEETEVLIIYEAWIDDLSKLKENEVIELDEDEELLEEDKEDGMWQVVIMAHIKSDSKKGFSLEEIMLKTQNQISNKELGNNCFFEGFEYMGHECEAYGLIDSEDGLPVFNVICGD